jgi:hypothetical protein
MLFGEGKAAGNHNQQTVTTAHIRLCYCFSAECGKCPSFGTEGWRGFTKRGLGRRNIFSMLDLKQNLELSMSPSTHNSSSFIIKIVILCHHTNF